MPRMASHVFVCGLLIDLGEHLFEALDLTFRFALVLLKGCLEVFVLRSLRHLRQSRQNLLLGEIDVFQSVVKQLVKRLRVGHAKPPQ